MMKLINKCEECGGTTDCKYCDGSGAINGNICQFCYPTAGEGKCTKCKGTGNVELDNEVKRGSINFEF